MRRRLGRLVTLDLGRDVPALRALSGTIPQRRESVIARTIREVLRQGINRAFDNAYRDGAMPKRTSRSYNQMRGRAQAYGTSLSSLRAHINAPANLVAHERGATITPINGDYLTIPIHQGLRGDGTPKLPSANSWRMLGSFVYKSKKTGQLYIARQNSQKRLEILYILVDSVELTKHKGWATDVMRKEMPFIIREITAVLTQAFDPNDVVAAFNKGARR
jgi:hypothetical protein